MITAVVEIRGRFLRPAFGEIGIPMTIATAPTAARPRNCTLAINGETYEIDADDLLRAGVCLYGALTDVALDIRPPEAKP